MIEWNEKREFVRVRCDTCEEPSPPTDDIFINRGLNNMGWLCKGGSHLCPKCRPDQVELKEAAE